VKREAAGRRRTYPFFFCKKERHKAGLFVMLLVIAANTALAAVLVG